MLKQPALQLCLIFGCSATAISKENLKLPLEIGLVAQSSVPVANKIELLSKQLTILAQHIPGDSNATEILEKIGKIANLLKTLQELKSTEQQFDSLILQSSLKAQLFELGNLVLKHRQYRQFRRYFWRTVSHAVKAFAWPKATSMLLLKDMLKNRFKEVWLEKAWENSWSFIDKTGKFGSFLLTVGSGFYFIFAVSPWAKLKGIGAKIFASKGVNNDLEDNLSSDDVFAP